jgi:hypothetical protein
VIEQQAKPGRALNRDLWAQGEDVEWQLDAFIRQRDKRRREEEGDHLEEELWKEATRRERARQREQNYHSLLSNERHLCGVYYQRYLEKSELIRELEGKAPNLR